MSSSRFSASRERRLTTLVRGLRSPGGAIYLLLAVLLLALLVYNPSITEPGQFTRFIGRSTPILIVAVGQYFVIVGGELDLSVGAVIAAQVVLAGNLIGQDSNRIWPVVGLMVVLALVIGVLNGVLTTLLRIPSFIATLGTALIISGLTFYSTGGAPSGNPVDSFRAVGRGGIDGVPLLGYLPYPVIVLAVLLVAAVALMRRPFGRLLMAAGDNSAATELTGASVWWLRTRAFIISALLSSLAAVLLVGYAGVSPVVGQGYEFTAITAVILGGVALSGGRGWLLSAAAAALALEVLFSLLDFVGVQSTWRAAVQGAIIIAALCIPLLRLRRRSSAPLSADSRAVATPSGVDGAEPESAKSSVARPNR